VITSTVVCAKKSPVVYKAGFFIFFNLAGRVNSKFFQHLSVELAMNVFKKLLFLSLFLLPVLANAQEDEFIDWAASRRLSWNDYKAEPLFASDAAAITSTTLGFEYHLRNNTLSYKITCRFSKNKSWGKYQSAYILSHEQGHFDITEIFARQLARAIVEYKFNPSTYQEDLSKIYKKVMKDKEEFQTKYDEHTDFSRNKEKQAEWLKKIIEELEKLDDYSSYAFISRT
jgi:hypothetical protein